LDTGNRLIEIRRSDEATMYISNHCILICAHQARVPHHIRAEDRGQPALGVLGCQCGVSPMRPESPCGDAKQRILNRGSFHSRLFIPCVGKAASQGWHPSRSASSPQMRPSRKGEGGAAVRTTSPPPFGIACQWRAAPPSPVGEGNRGMRFSQLFQFHQLLPALHRGKAHKY